jgi:hypothetical protein
VLEIVADCTFVLYITCDSNIKMLVHRSI